MTKETRVFSLIERTDSADGATDFRSFNLGLDRRLSGPLTIRNRIASLAARRQKRLSSSFIKEEPTPQHALWQSQFGWILGAFDAILEPTATVSIEMHCVDITTFFPGILAFVRMSADAIGSESKLTKEDWAALLSACEDYRVTPFTLPEACEMDSVLRWCVEHNEGDSTSLKSLALDELSKMVEADYRAMLSSVLSAIEDSRAASDIVTITELMLHGRANLVLDADTQSPAFAASIFKDVHRLTAYHSVVERHMRQTCRDCIQQLSESALTLNWRAMDDALEIARCLFSHPNLAPAFDIWRELLLLRERRMAAFATYLYASDLEIGDDTGSYSNLLGLVNALQTEHQP